MNSLDNKKRISVHIATRDRFTELALLLQSLRTQTYPEWDIVMLDDGSGTPIQSLQDWHFLYKLVSQIKLEGHHFLMLRNDYSNGVCAARQKLIDEDTFNNDFICRVDDDVILEPDYLEKLVNVIDEGFDIASGITPAIGIIPFIRDTVHLGPIINKVQFDEEGKIIDYKDECGMQYTDEKIITANEFRSCALMRKEVCKRVRYPKKLTKTGFREEAFFSYKAQWEGFKIGVHTGAVAWHLLCPSGGTRYQEYQQNVQQDQKLFEEWVQEKIKKHGDFTKKVI